MPPKKKTPNGCPVNGTIAWILLKVVSRMLCGPTNAVEPDLDREQFYEERLLLDFFRLISLSNLMWSSSEMSFTLPQTSSRTDHRVPIFFLYSTSHSNRYLAANIPYYKRYWHWHRAYLGITNLQNLNMVVYYAQRIMHFCTWSGRN
jgi:hypothetical protein